MSLAGLRLSRRPKKRLWLGVVVVSACLHGASLAYVASRAQQVNEDDALGAAVLEIGINLVSPRQEQEDLPPGEEAEASVASTASVQQTAKIDDVEAPKEKPTDPQDAERLVSPDVKQPEKVETPRVEESKADASPEAMASEATAPPKLEAAREAPRASAPAIGSGASAQLVRTTWQKQLVAHLNRFKRYPAVAPHAMQIIIAFTLDRLGHVVSATVERGSGDPAFDHAALAMVTMANPVPPPPPLVADEGLKFSIPVHFGAAKR